MSTKKNDRINENEKDSEARPAATDQEINSDRKAPDDCNTPENEYYEFPGIEVTDRKVNRWLIAVYVILAIWSIYYLVSFWNG